MLVGLRVSRRLLRELVTLGPSFRRFLQGQPAIKRLSQESKDRLSDLYLSNTELVMEGLENLEGVYHQSLIEYLQRTRLQEAQIIESDNFVERMIARFKPENIDEMLRAYYLERKIISQYQS